MLTKRSKGVLLLIILRNLLRRPQIRGKVGLRTIFTFKNAKRLIVNLKAIKIMRL